jgi:preprotein translocase SecE subunit
LTGLKHSGFLNWRKIVADKKPSAKRPSSAKKATASTASRTKVTVKKVSTAEPKKSAKKVTAPRQKRGLPKFLGFLRPIGAYFAGAWYELRQVRWPDRKATWGLTLAVILFSLFFAGLILGLDFVFQTLFKKILL